MISPARVPGARRKRPSIPISTAAVVALVLFSGCLPYSCRNEESTALMPADSVSRQIAGAVPADTLDLLWTATEPLEYPRTVRFAGQREGTIYVSDVERDAVLVFDGHGTVVREIEAEEVPYIAGIRGDTLAVFNPSDLLINLLVDGEPVRSIGITDEGRSQNALVYAAYGDDLYYKRIGPDQAGFIDRLDGAGGLLDRYPLAGPHWRHAGLLRMWGDTLVSLSGFRPVVDLLHPSSHGSSAIDTLALRGFDSPMLARSRSFMLGEVTEAPLLSSSAAAHGPHLFVVNMRAGWLHVDVFDRTGKLRHRLVERNPDYRKSFFPQDIDVLRRADGSYVIAVALSQSPELRLYEWNSAAEDAQ